MRCAAWISMPKIGCSKPHKPALNRGFTPKGNRETPPTPLVPPRAGQGRHAIGSNSSRWCRIPSSSRASDAAPSPRCPLQTARLAAKPRCVGYWHQRCARNLGRRKIFDRHPRSGAGRDIRVRRASRPAGRWRGVAYPRGDRADLVAWIFVDWARETRLILGDGSHQGAVTVDRKRIEILIRDQQIGTFTGGYFTDVCLP